jgi:hypothetical protein
MNRCSLGVKILILENTGRYRFPEILIEVRAAFLELALRKNARRMLAKNARKSEEITSHRFGIVVLKTGLSVSRPFENSGVEWVLLILGLTIDGEIASASLLS